MKKSVCKALLSLLCALTLLMGVVPFAAFQVAAVGTDFPWTKQDTLLEQILQRDGLLDGVWYPWFNASTSGHNLTGNDLMAKYYDTKDGKNWATVELDNYGADNVYREIYNLKAMGFNMMAWGGSIYGEGVIFDDYGDVLGIKQEYLDNARRLLDMCREIGMPVMWNIYFHSDSCANYYGIDGWNILSRMLCDPTVADHYAERFVKPLCKMLGEYPDVVALISIADEPENEINDSEIGNHFDGREMYGVAQDNMVYFMKGINDAVRETLPNMPRTVASNSMNKAIYSGFDLDLMGHNKYDNNGNVDATSDFFTDADIILTEYNVGGESTNFTDAQLADYLIKFRKGFMAEGYQGGFQWCWIPNATDAAYYMLNSRPTSMTDFKETVTLLRHYIDDYRAEHQGKTITVDKPVLYANDGTGLVEWIPSRQATKMTLERSDDGGKTWKKVLTDVDPAKYITKGKGSYRDTTAPKSGFCYRITVSDAKDNKAVSDPNDVAGTDQKYYKSYTFTGVDYETGIYYEPAVFKKDQMDKARLIKFGVAQNRPYTAEDNLIQNSNFESTTGGQWNNSAFLKNAKMSSDKTAVSGSKSLYFDTTSVTEGSWYKFTVNVEPNTDYTLSTWIKGAYLGPNNAGKASFGVYDDALGGFMVYWEYYRDYARASRLTQQIYPTAWDNEWHLRSVQFNSGNQTTVTIALYGYGSKLWLDDIALFKSDAGVNNACVKPTSYLSYKWLVECATCDPAKSVTQNVRFDDSKSTFWQTGDGWRNGFLSIADNKYEYGKSLKYTASSNPIGNYYAKWIKIEPKTEYVFSFSLKILKGGQGKISILEDTMAKINENLAVEFDAEMFGNDWFQYSIRFNSSNLDSIAIAICDLGGEALIDNLRLFKVSDAKVVADPFKDSTGGTVAPPTATVNPAGIPTASDTSAVDPTDGTTTLPSDGITDPTDVDPSAPSQDGVTDPTAPADDGEEGKDETKKDKGALASALTFQGDYVLLGVILYVGLAAVIAAAVLVTIILLRKKKAPTDIPDQPTDTPDQPTE